MRRYIYFDGREMLLCEWAREFKIKRQTLSKRIDAGWDLAEAMRHPVRDNVSKAAAEARAAGIPTYESVPCRACGGVTRITRSGSCLGCKRENARKKHKEKTRKK
jgi:hypothetical protein